MTKPTYLELKGALAILARARKRLEISEQNENSQDTRDALDYIMTAQRQVVDAIGEIDRAERW